MQHIRKESGQEPQWLNHHKNKIEHKPNWRILRELRSQSVQDICYRNMVIRLHGLLSAKFTKTQVQFLGTWVKGNASEWFTRNIEHPGRPIKDWSLEAVIDGLQKRFLNSLMHRQASNKFDTIKQGQKMVQKLIQDLTMYEVCCINGVVSRWLLIQKVTNSRFKTLFTERGIRQRYLSGDDLFSPLKASWSFPNSNLRQLWHPLNSDHVPVPETVRGFSYSEPLRAIPITTTCSFHPSISPNTSSKGCSKTSTSSEGNSETSSDSAPSDPNSTLTFSAYSWGCGRDGVAPTASNIKGHIVRVIHDIKGWGWPGLMGNARWWPWSWTSMV